MKKSMVLSVLGLTMVLTSSLSADSADVYRPIFVDVDARMVNLTTWELTEEAELLLVRSGAVIEVRTPEREAGRERETPLATGLWAAMVAISLFVGLVFDTTKGITKWTSEIFVVVASLFFLCAVVIGACLIFEVGGASVLSTSLGYYVAAGYALAFLGTLVYTHHTLNSVVEEKMFAVGAWCHRTMFALAIISFVGIIVTG